MYSPSNSLYNATKKYSVFYKYINVQFIVSIKFDFNVCGDGSWHILLDIQKLYENVHIYKCYVYCLYVSTSYKYFESK